MLSTHDHVTRRLAEQTWAWLDGQTGDVLTWLQTIGCTIVSRPEHGQTWMLRGIAGSNAGLTSDADPIAIASAIGLLCGGMLWPQAFPGLLPLVNAEWHRRMRAKRTTS